MFFTLSVVSLAPATWVLQTPPKRVTVESKEENPFRKVLGTPARASVKNSAGTGTPTNRVNISASPASSVPHRTGLLENRQECYHLIMILLKFSSLQSCRWNSVHLEVRREYVSSFGFAVTFNRMLIRAFLASGWYWHQSFMNNLRVGQTKFFSVCYVIKVEIVEDRCKMHRKH